MSFDFTYHGHATLALDVDGYHLLVDPYFSGNPHTRFSPDAVKADFILVTHGHGDHVGDSVAIAKRTGALVISNYEISRWFANQDVKAHGQHIGGGYNHPFGYLKLTQALHGSVLPDGTYGGNPAGLLLTTPSGEKIYMAGDTGLFGDMRLIGDEGLDLAVIPIGDNFTMGPDDALRAVKLLRPKFVVPIHFDTFEPIRQDAAAWIERVAAETNTQPVLMVPDQTLTFPR
jgi:L-ascorbate metabolism protein UlaG (beta-lactamase superfamily)